MRDGTAKLLTRFYPATGQVRVTGVTCRSKGVRPGWLKEELEAMVASRPGPARLLSPAEHRAVWEAWQEGVRVRPTLGDDLPPLRMLLVWDHLAGHQTPELVCGRCAHGILPGYTPLGGSWLNLTEWVPRILVRRALAGLEPKTPQDSMDWLEATARGWNADPRPLVWGRKRQERRRRSWERRHRLGGSGACTRRPLPRRTLLDQWRCSQQMTH
ncbi:MAG: transposase [Chloroflexi bacterium]|nr:transposase [Chloroflexota bacterium]